MEKELVFQEAQTSVEKVGKADVKHTTLNNMMACDSKIQKKKNIN